MNRSLSLSLAALLAAGPAVARDGRIQTVVYQPDQVVPVGSTVGYVTQITLWPGEQVQNTACGFSKGWSVTADGNQIYLMPQSVKQGEDSIKPTPGDWATNLLVTTTSKGNVIRHYAFRLSLQPTPVYRLQFVYPDEQRREMAKAAVKRRLSTAAMTPTRNWHYSMQVADGSDAIAPVMAYDDGRFTYLRFSGNRPMPAVFAVSAVYHQESLVNTHIDPDRPDVLVVQQVVPELALRLGNQAVGVFNDAYDAEGLPPVEGTTVPGVRRLLRAAAASE